MALMNSGMLRFTPYFWSIYIHCFVCFEIVNVKVSENTWIGSNTLLGGSSGLSIGSFGSVSKGIRLYSHHSVEWATSGGQADPRYAEPNFGGNTHIGQNSIVTKGVSIGRGCIIGAQSFVNTDVADGQKVAGSPARPISVK